MEDERATAPAMNEAGGVESPPIGPSNLSDTDGIQESELEFDLERLLHDQPLDQDEEAYFPSPFSSAEDLLSQDLIQGSSSVEPDGVDPRNTLIQSIESEEPSFKMNEDDYAEMRLSLGISGQARSVGRKKSVADIPSPTTPGKQIAQEAGTLVDQLESPLQRHHRRLGGNLVPTPNETLEESIKRPRSQRKRAYELLEQETAAILENWNPATQIATRYTNETARKLRKSKATTTVPPKQKSKLDNAALITCTPWRVLPQARLEVLIRAKRKVVLASYENVDGAGERAKVHPRKGGHHGRGRTRAATKGPKTLEDHVFVPPKVVPESSNNVVKSRARVRRVIGGRTGIIGTRRSQRTTTRNSSTTSSTIATVATSSVRSTPVLAARPRGRPKRRGRPRIRPSTSKT